MNRDSSSTRSGRVPLSSRWNSANIENGVNAKTKKSLGSILPSKKDSRPVSFAAAAIPPPTALTTFTRQSSTITTTSIASGSTGGGGISAVLVGGGENNCAFDSLSSDTLRQVIGTISNNTNNNVGGNGDDFDAGVDPSSNVGGGIMMNKKV